MNSRQRITTLPSPPLRPIDAHKGTFGRVVIIAGSEGMSGAACLCGYGALRGGAGLVTIATPACVAPIVASVQPSWMTCHLPDQGGQLSVAAMSSIDQCTAGASAVAIGPGLRLSPAVATIVEHVYQTCQVPLVVDADALNVLAMQRQAWTVPAQGCARVLTPHPGEFARLTGHDTLYVQSHREELAIEFAAKQGVVLLLKGRQTVITDGEQLAVNTTGHSGMATGGAGDVLTGLLASLLAQGMSAFSAAQFAAHLHGLAGEAAAEQIGERAMIADDIQQHIAVAWKRWNG